MHQILAQSNDFVSNHEGAGILNNLSFSSVLFLVGTVIVGLRILSDKFHRDRIRSHIKSCGGETLDITWLIWGSNGIQNDGHRYYEVCYKAKTGKIITATCTVSGFSGVQWISNTPPESPTAGESFSSETSCLSCGTIIPENASKCSHCGWSYNDSPKA